MIDWIVQGKAVLMGLVEGITEFLPVSSTGHLIITGELIGFLDKDKRDLFEIVIQLGAILAVCWVYHQRLYGVARDMWTQRQAQRFVANLLIAFLPAAVLGVLLIDIIKHYLFSPVPVAVALIVGGVLILWAERREHQVKVQTVDDMRWQDALRVGLAQCLALIPGTSRSGATIIGGLLFGLSRTAATEFSFFLAIPVMVAATAYDLLKHRELLEGADWGVFATGFLMSFVSALLAVKGLLRYIAHRDFGVFAYYRIAFGAALLALTWGNILNWQA